MSGPVRSPAAMNSEAACLSEPRISIPATTSPNEAIRSIAALRRVPIPNLLNGLTRLIAANSTPSDPARTTKAERVSKFLLPNVRPTWGPITPTQALPWFGYYAGVQKAIDGAVAQVIEGMLSRGKNAERTWVGMQTLRDRNILYKGKHRKGLNGPKLHIWTSQRTHGEQIAVFVTPVGRGLPGFPRDLERPFRALQLWPCRRFRARSPSRARSWSVTSRRQFWP